MYQIEKNLTKEKIQEALENQSQWSQPQEDEVFAFDVTMNLLDENSETGNYFEKLHAGFDPYNVLRVLWENLDACDDLFTEAEQEKIDELYAQTSDDETKLKLFEELSLDYDLFYQAARHEIVQELFNDISLAGFDAITENYQIDQLQSMRVD